MNESPSALFSIYELHSSSGKHIEEIDHAHIVCLMFKLLTSARNTDDLSTGFDRDRGRRKRKLTNNKYIKGKCHVTIMLKNVFGFTYGTYGVGYKLTLTRNNDSAVLNKGNAINNANIKNNSNDFYVPTYTTSLGQEKILLDQLVKKMPTELRYIEGSVFKKRVTPKTYGFLN